MKSFRTVAVEVLKPSSSPPPTPPVIQMLGHCIICLRKTSLDERKKVRQYGSRYTLEEEFRRELWEQVPSAVFPDSVKVSGFLKTLNRVWEGIQNSGKKKKNAGVTGDLLDFFSRDSSSEPDGVFRDIPDLCQFCVEKLESVEKLMKKLLEMLDKLGSIARESKCGGAHGWRGDKFVRTLTGSNLERDSIRQTLELLGLKGPLDTESFLASASSLHPDTDPLADCSNHEVSDDEVSESPPEEDQLEVEFADENDFDDNIKSEGEEEAEEEEEKDNQVDDDDSNWPMVNEEGDSDEDDIKPEVKEEIVLSSDSEDDTYYTDEDDDGDDTDDDEFYTDVDLHPGSSSSQQGPSSSNSTTILITPEGKIINSPQQKCDLCDDMVPLSSILEHVRAHVGDTYLIKCPNQKCSFVFAKPRSVSDHLTKSVCGNSVPAPDKKKFKDAYNTCEICGYDTWRPPLFKRHLLSKHRNSNKTFPCPITNCQETFHLKQSVVLHISKDHGSSPDAIPQSCCLCNQQIKVDEMESHLKTSHQSSEVIKCTHCPFLFPNRELLLDHLYIHRYDSLSCDICNDGAKFPYHANLRKHFFEVHKIGKSFPCDQCENVYWNPDSLKLHVRMRHCEETADKPVYKKKGTSFKCKECNLEWRTQYPLQDHNISCHGAEPWTCRFCSETFTRRYLLEKHALEHKGSKNKNAKFRCDVPGCEKEFKAERTLKLHVSAVHRGERPYVCDVCGKSFPHPAQLGQHKNRVHLGIRPHICEICGDSFAVATTMEIHKLIHTGERPFSCKICGQRFRQGCVLRKHLEGHQKKGADFKPNGPMKGIRKRVKKKAD